jgi:HJR/Mrr/RecB family endonuclease
VDEIYDSFSVAMLYSNNEIYKSLGVGNTGGIRVKKLPDGEVQRIVIFTSIPTTRQIIENPYHDRLEGDVLIYTGTGKAGEQTVSGLNARIVEQELQMFPIYAFIQISGRRNTAIGVKRWGFLGLLEYLRCYQEEQIDSHNETRTVWVFEFRVHTIPQTVQLTNDTGIMRELINAAPKNNDEDKEVINHIVNDNKSDNVDKTALENTRKQLLAYDPERFEHIISDILLRSGFNDVSVTRYSQDGGIDINARLDKRIWPLRHLLAQIQAKRWLHTVGRKEVAELRGSLQPHAAGCIVTTSHFSRAAVAESTETGKVPITIVDGYELAQIVQLVKLDLSV